MAAVTVGAKEFHPLTKQLGVALSTGQLWVAGYDGVTGDIHFFYSNDDGATWSEDTGAEVTDVSTGIENYPLDLFADFEDTLWLLYKDDTTTGGDLDIYRGTVSGNAITWVHKGLVAATTGNGNGGAVIAFKEGSNVRVFVAFSNSLDDQLVQALYSSGSFGSWTNEHTDSNANSTHFLLDFNHTGDGKTLAGDPDVWWGRVIPEGGPGRSLEVTKIVWSTGPVWTPNTDRVLSTTLADNFNGCFGFWDGTRWVSGGLQSDGDIEMYDRNEADSATDDLGYEPTTTSTPTTTLPLATSM
jgi:hypothetical protein